MSGRRDAPWTRRGNSRERRRSAAPTTAFGDTTISSRPGCTTRTPSTRPSASRSDVSHRRDRCVDPGARAGQEEGGLISFAAVRSLRPEGERWTLTEVAATRRDRRRARGCDLARRRVSPIRGRSSAASARRYSRCSSWSAISPTFVGSRSECCSSCAPTGEAIARIARGRDRVVCVRISRRRWRRRVSSSRSRALTRRPPQLFPRVTERHRRVPPSPARADRPPLQRRERADIGCERGRARGRVRRHRGLHRPFTPARSGGARGHVGALRSDHG